jgi:hypothetical protein
LAIKVGMRGIPIVNHEERPSWWYRFLEDIPPVQSRVDQAKWERYNSWIKDVNDKLMLHGGTVRRMERVDCLMVTFRLDSNYTMFMLKYA